MRHLEELQDTFDFVYKINQAHSKGGFNGGLGGLPCLVLGIALMNTLGGWEQQAGGAQWRRVPGAGGTRQPPTLPPLERTNPADPELQAQTQQLQAMLNSLDQNRKVRRALGSWRAGRGWGTELPPLIPCPPAPRVCWQRCRHYWGAWKHCGTLC